MLFEAYIINYYVDGKISLSLIGKIVVTSGDGSFGSSLGLKD